MSTPPGAPPPASPGRSASARRAPRRWRRRPRRCAQRFEATFWCEDLGLYALALDGEKRPCRVRSSNAGHVLLGGLASPERAASVARQMLDGSFHSGWGIRTLATTEARYNPMSYHNGSVWPHDTALVGLGLARYGHRAAAAKLLEGLTAAAGKLDLRRLPELFCGFPRRGGQGPTAYPVACAPQAWAAAAPIGLLGACLGLSFDPAARHGAAGPAGAAGGAGPGAAARPVAGRRADRRATAAGRTGRRWR